MNEHNCAKAGIKANKLIGSLLQHSKISEVLLAQKIMNVLKAFGCRENSGSGDLHKLQKLEEYYRRKWIASN